MRKKTSGGTLDQRLREILESARAGVARAVKTTQVIANWLVGREIVEEEQQGTSRAGYGERLMGELSERLLAGFGGGYLVDNLEWLRQFYLAFPRLLVMGNKTCRADRPRACPLNCWSAIGEHLMRSNVPLGVGRSSLILDQRS